MAAFALDCAFMPTAFPIPRPGAPCRGLTLIELMVTLSVVVVLLLVIAPSFTDYLARRRLEGVANELSADLQYARAQAVDNGAPVLLSTSATGYAITGQVTQKQDGPPITYQTTTVTYKTIVLPTGLAVSQPLVLSFEPERGSLVPVAGVTPPVNLTVTNVQTAASLRATVQSTGRVALCSPSGSFSGYVPCK